MELDNEAIKEFNKQLLQLGDDFLAYSITSNECVINVHYSNSTTKAVRQLQCVCEFIHKYQNITFYMIGDFNSNLVIDNGNHFKIYSKDKTNSNQLLYETIFNDRFIHLSDTSGVATTCKIRIITLQLQKMFQHIESCIDYIIVITNKQTTAPSITTEEDHNSDLTSTTTGNISATNVLSYDNNIITTNQYSSWYNPSDHHILSYTYNNDIYLTWNLCGESSTGTGQSFNYFEFLPYEIYIQYTPSQLEDIYTRIHNIIYDIGITTDMINNKYFSTILRNTPLFNNHYLPSTEIGAVGEPQTQKEVYNIQYAEYLAQCEPCEAPEHSQGVDENRNNIRVAGALYMKYWDTIHSDPVLKPFFESWYKQRCNIQTKSAISYILHILTCYTNVRVIALQEVSAAMRAEWIGCTLPLYGIGYKMVWGEGPAGKTSGALIVRIA